MKDRRINKHTVTSIIKNSADKTKHTDDIDVRIKSGLKQVHGNNQLCME